MMSLYYAKCGLVKQDEASVFDTLKLDADADPQDIASVRILLPLTVTGNKCPLTVNDNKINNKIQMWYAGLRASPAVDINDTNFKSLFR